MKHFGHKQIRDNVHGYISIPEPIMHNIIDTELFQRLRYIEQTSMRVLYPSARHDRFIHSLGVYQLGVMAFDAFEKNVKSRFLKEKDKSNPHYKFFTETITEAWWKKTELLFQLACLLHDCAHSPFSHTLESIYELPKVSDELESKIKEDYPILEKLPKFLRLDYELIELYKNENFIIDFFNTPKLKGLGAPHEKLSALQLFHYEPFHTGIQTVFREMLDLELDINDFEFMSRMIIGCCYFNKTNQEFSLKNCVISLLNSSSLDVDGLDYMVRDSHMSGMDNISIDYKRLLSSLTICEVTVFNNAEFSKQELQPMLWFKDSVFHVSDFEGDLTGAAGFSDFKNIDATEILPDIERDGETKKTKDTTKVHIKSKHRFILTALNTCEIRGEFSGKVTGKCIGNYRELAADKSHVEYTLAYHKNCISVLQNAADARNHDYLWVYSHPKVIYQADFLQCYLLQLSAKFICCKRANKEFSSIKLNFSHCDKCKYMGNLQEAVGPGESPKHKSPEDIMLEILGFESFLNSQKQPVNAKFYHTNDNDLLSLYKTVYIENKYRENLREDNVERYFEQFFSRKHSRPLWKSSTDFKRYFHMPGDDKTIQRLIDEVAIKNPYKYGFISGTIRNILDKHGIKHSILVKWNLFTKEMGPYNTIILFKDDPVRLIDVMDKEILKEPLNKNSFYLYGDTEPLTNQTILVIVEELKNEF